MSSRPTSRTASRDAIVAAETSASPLELTLSQDDVTRTVRVDYHDGLRIPHLQRDPAKPDLLKEVLAPRAAPPGDGGANRNHASLLVGVGEDVAKRQMRVSMQSAVR